MIPLAHSYKKPFQKSDNGLSENSISYPENWVFEMIQDLDLRLISLVSLLSSELYDIKKIHIVESTINGVFFPQCLK
jgi:hypothetical protein